MTPADVMAEAAAWVWVPDDARTVERPEFLVVAYPEHFSFPTIATRWSPGYADVDAVLAAAGELDRDTVWFSEVAPGPLREELEARGAELAETLSVLALDLSDGVPDLDPPGDVTIAPVTSLEEMRAVDELSVAAFGGRVRTDEELAEGDWSGRVLAVRDGRPVGTAGTTRAGGTVRLWGAVVDPAARHTGVYRALLDARLRGGGDLALVKGRVETSAPVLTRAGFSAYGEVRAYRLPA